MKKKIIPILLSVAMIMSAVPGNIFAAELEQETVEVDDFSDDVEIEAFEKSENLIAVEEESEQDNDAAIEENQNEENVFSDGEENAVEVGEENSKGITASGEVNENITWTLYDDGELVIAGSGEMPDGFFPWGSLKVKEVRFVGNIKSIGNFAFWGCSDLEKIELPEGIEDIGESVFYYCTSLKEITLPKTIKSIGKYAFWGCSDLEKIELPEGIEDIGESVFYYCWSLKKLTLPSTIKNIGESAFSGCRSLKEITLPKTIKSIGKHAFWDCNNLEKIELPEGIEDIGESVFSGCANLKYIVFEGTKDEWNKINQNESGLENIKIYYKKEIHEHDYEENILKSATCIEMGERELICSICGDSKTEEIPATGHVWDSGNVIREATCEELGIKAYICTVCEATQTEDIPALGHVWNDGIITKEPTCIETVEKTYTCTVCGKIKREEIPAVGHIEIKDEAVDPTCEEPGLTEGSHCSVCGVVIKKQEEIPATGHKEVKDAAVEPTCEIPGKTEGIHCENCGKVLKEQEEIPATGHRYSLGYTIKEATCKEKGEKEYTCSVCGKNKVEEIPAKEHTWSNTYIIEEDATCTEPGKKDIRCINCGAIKENSVKEIPAVGHIEIKDEAVDPTCEEPGLTEGSHCSVCGVVIKKQEEIPATGHKFTKKKVVSQATVFRAARQEYECTTCGFKEIRNVGNKLKATIKVSTSKIIMKPQQKVTSLKVTFTKGDSVTSWKTSNSKVVKVAGKSKGTCTLIAGKIGGTATLTIKLKSGLSKKVSVIVNVKTQKITGISSKITLVKGQYITIKPKLYPATSTDQITFKSNNNTVSVNSSGKIYARKKGTAVITVKSGNKTVKSQITVEDPKISKTAISLNIGKKYTLKVTGTKQKITWSSSDKSVATVSSKGVVTAKKGGSAKITAKVLGKSYVCTVTVKGNTVNTILTVDKKKLTMSGSTIIKITSRTGGALRWETNKNNIVTCRWGEWSKNQNGWAIKLYVNAQTIGSDTITILDKDSRQKVKIPVNVKKVSKSSYSDEEKMAGYAMGFLLDYFKNRSSLTITHVGYLVNQYGKSVVMIDYKAKNSYGNYVYKNITVGIEDNLSATSHGFQIGVSDWPNKYLMVIRNSSPRYKEFTNMLDTDRVIDFINQYGSIYYSNVEVPYYNSFWVEKDWYLNEFDFG